MASPVSRISLHDLQPPQGSFRDDVLQGLARPQKAIPPKHFYDARGCALFEAICGLPEYYLTRSELALMRAHAAGMGAALGPDTLLIEIGCGNSEKTRLLLEALRPAAFVPVDLAQQQLEASCTALARAFPELVIAALRADFSLPLALPDLGIPAPRRRAIYFPGSTIGNFTAEETVAFLRRSAGLLGAGGAMLVGVDLKKDPRRLDAAYNDAQGVTAAFNLNLLARANLELGADFDLARFRHRAFYDAALGRIEMHLASVGAQRVTVAGRPFGFRDGETIHTEISCKYGIEEFQALAAQAGFAARAVWTDGEGLFAVHYLEAIG